MAAASNATTTWGRCFAVTAEGTRYGPLSRLRGQGARSAPSSHWRCADCFGDVMYCASCIVHNHRENPLHRIEASARWHDGFFVKTSLRSLGLRIQLGHHPHEPCPAPERAHTDFVALHTNGIHEVLVDFCGCENAYHAGPHEQQLLRAGWFPATHERPQTCATLAVLEKFHRDTVQAKTTMYDFYGVLEKLTDNTGVKPPDRYHEWIRMCRQFQHLLLLKRGARAEAYSPSGVAGTKQGELAVECPACPRPGVNLPEGWENTTPEERFLITLFIAMDACFQLKRRLISSELKDPDLGPGWAYMVETGPYREYLRGVMDQKEMNSCSGLAALDYANTKFSRGYSTTGVGMGCCARHEFVQPNGVGDLQKGEQQADACCKFSNMDYIWASIMVQKDENLPKLMSYDIMCSWKVHLLERLKALPPSLRLRLILAILSWAIPKMHIHAHTLLCQLLFSLNLILGSGQSECEGIERIWSGIGGVATSTREMGPGSRHDALDCHWSYWNWMKLVNIAKLLRSRMDRAKEELKEQTEAFEEFSAQQAERVPEWKEQVLAFEADNKKKNPYEVTQKGLTEAQVRLQFSKEEAEEAARGVPSLHDISPSSFIAAGLDLEEEQRRVRLQAELKKAQTTAMQIDLGGMRRKLNRGILRFRKIQQTYMPAAIQALGDKHLPSNVLAEDVPLLLPSVLSEAQRALCAGGVEHVEALMRDAQCRSGLTRLRNQLHIKSRLLTYKKHQVRHQGANTRSRTIITQNESKIRLHSEKYQTAWDAIRKLHGGNEAMVGWRVLRREDIWLMEDAEDLRKKEKDRKARADKRRRKNAELREHGILPAEVDDDMDWEDEEQVERGPENQRQLSWIWTMAGADGTDAGLENGKHDSVEGWHVADLYKALRVEWSKAFARVRRWGEENRLLVVEYERVLCSFEFEAAKWEARAAAVPVGVIPRAQAEAAVAYARRQAAMYHDLRDRAAKTWTEEKLARGKRRARHVPSAVRAMELEARAEQEDEEFGSLLGDEGADDEDEDAML
ncbi:hypothetical protein B0H13DRAFT_1650401 [Mycena leptocephala]|nr:hypothetical protein B0H13DRAFT_1650401 [Mycena leptocephala]